MNIDDKKTKLKELSKIIEDDFKDFGPLKKLSKETKVSPINLICGINLLLIVMILNGILSDFCVFLIGFVYPFYKTCLLLNKHNKRKKEKNFWLIYWVIFIGLKEFKLIFRFFLFFLPNFMVNLLLFLLLIALFYPRSPLIPTLEKYILKLMRDHSQEIEWFEKNTKENYKKLVGKLT